MPLISGALLGWAILLVAERIPFVGVLLTRGILAVVGPQAHVAKILGKIILIRSHGADSSQNASSVGKRLLLLDWQLWAWRG